MNNSPDKPKSAQRPTARELVDSGRLLIIAHRGDSHAAPENTLPAFEPAVRIGVDFIEFDYRHSADQVPVAFHDDTLDRTTDAVKRWGGRDIALAGKTLAELKQLDAGSWHGERFAGTRIPTLEEALDVIQAGSLALIERKSGDAATCIELLRRKGLLEYVVVQSFDWEFLVECHRLAPELTLAALGDKKLPALPLPLVGAAVARIVGWDESEIDENAIEDIHRHGHKAWAWTVDDPGRARLLAAAGVDALITNLPGKMRPLLAK